MGKLEKSWPGTWYGIGRFLQVAGRPRLTRCTSACCCRSTAPIRHATNAAARGSRPKRWPGGSARRMTRIACCRRETIPAARRAVWRRGTHTASGLTAHDLALLPIDKCAASSTSFICRAPLDEATGLLLTETRTPALLSYAGRVGLSHARSPVAHAVRRRGATHQSHYRARTSLVNTLFAARTNPRSPASGGYGRVIGVMHKIARPPAIRGGRRARSADHARRGPHPRHGAGTRPARR